MMKTILSTFLLVFLAELGDKTQLSVMLLSSKSGSVWLVFLGAASALVLSTLVGAFAGVMLNKYIPANYIQVASGAAFVIIGILLLFKKL